MLNIHLALQADDGRAFRIRCVDSDIFATSLGDLKAIVPAAYRRFDFSRPLLGDRTTGRRSPRAFSGVDASALPRGRVCRRRAGVQRGQWACVGGIVQADNTRARLQPALHTRGRVRGGSLCGVQDAGLALPPDADSATAEMAELNQAYDLLIRQRDADAA